MKLKELKAALAADANAQPRFTLSDGDHIPAHFHITEVGHVTKRFIDCGGKVHDRSDTCVLQAWVGDDVDHRLNAGTFAKILDLGAKVLPHDDLEVEVEYDCCISAQYPVVSVTPAGEHIDILLAEKHTDCLARKRMRNASPCCGDRENSSERAAATCC
jgi:hypothetical protein